MNKVFIELDDLYNRHIALEANRIIAFQSQGDGHSLVVMDNGHEVQVKHSVSDLLDRLQRVLNVYQKPEPEPLFLEWSND